MSIVETYTEYLTFAGLG